MTEPASRPVDGDSAEITVPWVRVDRFIGQLTHDLRNGLNAIELQLTLLGEDLAGGEVQEDVRRLRASLAGISRDLQAVRASCGAVNVSLLKYPVADLLDDLQERLLRHKPNGHRIDCDWKVEPAALGPRHVQVDPELLFDAWLRLFDNAWQFRQTGEPPVFAADVSAGELHLRLREQKKDPPASGAELADWGTEPLKSTRRAGYGLGLFRARRVIEAQGGSFSVQYLEADHVLETIVSLPLVNSAAKAS